MSKTDLVVKHLKTRGHITSWEAIQKYRATRLADIFLICAQRVWPSTRSCVCVIKNATLATFIWEKNHD